MDNLWAQYETFIKQLYQVNTLKQVKEILESQYGFPEKPLHHYEAKLRDNLGVRKKLKADQWPAVYNYARSHGYQRFDVYVGNKRIPWKSAWKEIRRSGAHKMPMDLSHRELPPGVQIRHTMPDQITRPTVALSSIPTSISHSIPVRLLSPTRALSPVQSLTSRLSLPMVSRSGVSSGPRACGSATSNAIVPSRPTSQVSALDSSSTWGNINQVPLDISNFAVSLLDTLPWHQFRIKLYGHLISSKDAQPTFEECGGFSFAVMPVSFFNNMAGQASSRISDSIYPSLCDLIHLQNSTSALASSFDVYHFLATLVYILSNNLTNDQVFLNNIIDRLHRSVSRTVVTSFFRIGLDSIRAFWDKLHKTLRCQPLDDDPMPYFLEIIFCAQPRWIEESKNRLLWEVAQRGHISLLQRLLAFGAQPCPYRLSTGESIIAAAVSRSYACARLIVESFNMNTTLFSKPCLYREDNGSVCSKRHYPADAPVSHFSLFLEYIVAHPEDHTSHSQDVIHLLVDAGADFDLTMFSSCTATAKSHGDVKDIPLDWMPTYLDMCYYWNRPFFNLIRPHSVKIRKDLTRAGVCEAVRQGEHALTAYLQAVSSAHSVTEKTRFLELVLAESFYPSRLVRGVLSTRPAKQNMAIIRSLINFGVCIKPMNATGRYHSREDQLTELVCLFVAQIRGDPCNDNFVFILRHLFQNYSFDKGLVLSNAVQYTTANILEALGFVIARDLVELGPPTLAGAACNDNYEAVSWLLSNGVDINAEVVNKKEETFTIIGFYLSMSFLPGHSGRSLPNTKMLEHLIRRGARLRKRQSDSNCHSLLANALKILPAAYGIFYEQAAAEMEQIPSTQWQDIILSCAKNLELCYNHEDMRVKELELFEKLYQQHAPSLHAPVLAGYIRGGGAERVIQDMIASGVSIHDYTYILTPLQAAAAQCNLGLIAQLLDLGADVNAPSTYQVGATALGAICDWTPSSAADGRRKTDAIHLLLERGASIDGDGKPFTPTPLQVCVQQGDIANTTILVRRGASLNIAYCTHHRKEPLCALDSAAAYGRLDMTRYLLSLGALSATPGATGYQGSIEIARDYPAIKKLIEAHVSQLMDSMSADPRLSTYRAAGIEQHRVQVAEVKERFEQWTRRLSINFCT